MAWITSGLARTTANRTVEYLTWPCDRLVRAGASAAMCSPRRAGSYPGMLASRARRSPNHADDRPLTSREARRPTPPWIVGLGGVRQLGFSRTAPLVLPMALA